MLVGGSFLLIVNIVNKVIYRGVKLLCLLIRCCKYLGKLISIYKRMILFLNTVNLLICKYISQNSEMSPGRGNFKNFM